MSVSAPLSLRPGLCRALGVLASLGACSSEPQEPPSLGFTEVSVAAGLSYNQGGPEAIEEEASALVASGGGAVGDFDQDGRPDVFVTRVDGPDILFRNAGGGRFQDVTARAGLVRDLPTNGAAWGDIDNDGDLDLYVTVIHSGGYLLFVNDGSGHFTEEGVERNAVVAGDEPHEGWSVGFGDYDRDGWLDIHVTERQNLTGPAAFPAHTRLLHNLGSASPGHFEDVTTAAGVSWDDWPEPMSRSHAFESTFADMDDDGWPDLLVSADFRTSRLFWNDGDGTFTDGTVLAGVGLEQNGMGSSVGDYDGDGKLDWFVDSISCSVCGTGRGNRMYRNLGDRSFEEVTDAAGVRDGWWAWGTAFFDYDNDGDLDLVQTNGVSYRHPRYERWWNDPDRLWENQGNGTFRERAAELGLTDTRDGKALMILDYDDDGDLDVLVLHHAGTPALWRNDVGNRNAWCRVRLAGTVNRFGIGARISFQADAGGREQVQEMRASGAYLGQNEGVVHFGMGPGVRRANRIRVRWPTTGREQVLENVECNRTVVITEPPP